LSKRFTETGKWADPWFQDLAPVHKCVWSYILDSCDTAGVWVVNARLLSFQVGAQLTWEEIQAAMGDRLAEFVPGRVWVPKFIEFQYGALHPASKPHQKVISLLKGYGLWEAYQAKIKGYGKGIDTLQEEEEDQDKEEEKEKEEERGLGRTNPIPRLTVRSEEAVALGAQARINAAPVTQAHHDRARAVWEIYPIRSLRDGRAIRKDLASMNRLASKIAADPEFDWEDAARLEGLSDSPQDLGNWVGVQPDPLLLETRRKQERTPPPLKPGERPRPTRPRITA
jgi:hypothetical protein